MVVHPSKIRMHKALGSGGMGCKVAIGNSGITHPHHRCAG
jgi:hypothetical protein